MPASKTAEAADPGARNRTTTEGIEISVVPAFNEEGSNAAQNTFVYTYTIRITNRGSVPVQLISRHWIITDGFNRDEHVRGPGVVGQQPTLRPGESFEYSSYCPLPTPSGSMRGEFQMKREDGSVFDAVIGEFLLVNPALVN